LQIHQQPSPYTILFFILLLLSTATFAAFPPRPSGPVADFAGVIDQDTQLKINSAARKLWVEKKVGLVVVTVDRIGEMTIESYAEALFDAWGIGGKRDRSALLIVVGKEPPDVTVLYGKGDGTLRAKTDRTRFSHLSGLADIRSGNFSDGLLVLTAEVVRSVGGDAVAFSEEDAFRAPFTLGALGGKRVWGVFALLALVIAGVATTSSIRKRRFCAQPLLVCGYACRYTRGAFLSDW